MSVLGIIRIAAVVGLSAVKLVSTALKVKEAREQGLINPIFAHNNSNPYNNQPMNNNVYCSVPQQPMMNYEPVWNDRFTSESRRYSQPTTTFQQPIFAQPTQPVMNQYGYSEPVQAINNAPTPTQSRRFDVYTNYNPNAYVNQTWSQPYYNNDPVVQNTWTGITNWRQYYASKQQQPMYQQAPQPVRYYQYPGQNQELQWADKSLGKMNMNYAQPQRRSGPIFNWNSPWLRYTRQPQYDENGVVAMFYKDDGTPLFGPTPVVT